MSERKPVIVLAGPTGVGKTALAVELCAQLGGEIVGADSVQVHRHFNIGASKPTREELGDIRHHMIDVVDPDEHIDAARYAALASQAIKGIYERGAVPIIVGGTGLWLRALLRGLLELPKVDPALRTSLELEWNQRGASAMFAQLREVDPLSAQAIHENDRLRVVRALEVHAQTGQALGELRQKHALGVPRFNTLGLLLDLPSEHYRLVLARRTRAMLDAGFADEVRSIVARFGPDIRPLSSVGYRQMLTFLQQREGVAFDVEAEILRATRLYARRQRTWFASDPSITLRSDPSSARAPELLERLRAHCGATLRQ